MTDLGAWADDARDDRLSRKRDRLARLSVASIRTRAAVASRASR
jgi:hypothetical protein